VGRVVLDAVTTELLLAVRVAAVTIHDVAVVTLLAVVDMTIATSSTFLCREAIEETKGILTAFFLFPQKPIADSYPIGSRCILR
jgi:hypothetical protein